MCVIRTAAIHALSLHVPAGQRSHVPPVLCTPKPGAQLDATQSASLSDPGGLLGRSRGQDTQESLVPPMLYVPLGHRSQIGHDAQPEVLFAAYTAERRGM